MCKSGCFLLQMTAPPQTSLRNKGHLFQPVTDYLVQPSVTSIPSQAPVGTQAGLTPLPAPSSPLYNFFPPSGWPGLGHMSISGPITGAREMGCADWLHLGYMLHPTFKLYIIRTRERQCPQSQLEYCTQEGENVCWVSKYVEYLLP